MKKLFSLIVLFFVVISFNISNSDLTLQYIFLNPNNISSIFWNTGIFDQDPRTTNTPGFEWPKGSNKFAIFSTGINLSARVNGQIRQAMSSYSGEYRPGNCNDSIPVTNSNFKFYKVSRGDNQNTNPDWTNWGLMVPYGAPYTDVNHNGIYEPSIDTPGVKNAATTIFICLTDGFTSSHTSTEGFGGGTSPLYAEVHMTAWAYTQPSYSDMQFIKYEIINKSKKSWIGTYFSIVCDPDIGDPNDDYIACDTIRKLAICYNSTNDDPIYGLNPPAVGIILLKGITNNSVQPNVNLGMTSFDFFTNAGSPGPFCEHDPNPGPYDAYLFMKGYKADSSSWLDVTQPFNGNHYKRTKFCFYGDPETNEGWTQSKGKIWNCDMGRMDTGTVFSTDPDDRRFAMNSGAENFTFNAGDTQTVYLCQLIARGSSNLNSVTKLKQLADVAINFFNSGFTIGVKQISSVVPDKYELFQNYPNPFNPSTIIRFQIKDSRFVKLKVLDILGREVATLVNEKQNAGVYEVQFSGESFPSGIYFYQLSVDNMQLATKKMLMIK